METGNEDATARAIAFFEQTDDINLLREVLRFIRPRAESAALRASRQGKESPPPVDVTTATEAASAEQAMATVRATRDFGHLQAIARAAGRRAEELMQSR